MVAAGSPWSNRRLTFDVLDDVVRRFLLTLWNTYAFYVTYANVDGPSLAEAPPPADRPPLDRWALSRLHGLVASVRAGLDGFDATGAARRIEEFVGDLSNWYVRRSRRRFWDPARAGAGGGGGDEASASKASAYATLHECLVTLARLLAPFTPFVAEELYRNLAPAEDPDAPPSVHLTDYPEADMRLVDPALEERMAAVRQLVQLGRTVRTEKKMRVRQPLAHAVIHVPGDPGRLQDLLALVAEELNVKQVVFAESAEELAGWRAKPNYRVLGPRLGSRVRAVAEALAEDDGTLASRLAAGERVEVTIGSGATEWLSAEDVELVQQTREGWALATEGPFAVALELALTDDLRLEGIARELVHHVQALRKSAGLDVTDRIVLAVDATSGGMVEKAVGAFGEQLAADVLATSVSLGGLDMPVAEASVQVDGEALTIGLRRA
jgi:isoleucyl-tRNA synthetase